MLIKIQFPAALAIILICLFAKNANAQTLSDLQPSQKPLVLKAQGSFYIGGEVVEQTRDELGSFGPGGHITVNQMYVRYMVPEKAGKKPPMVMIHGMTLTGKCWETTPDGRMGWDEYFARKGHPVYVPDQVGRGRSGFNQASFNNARVGKTEAADMPPMWRFSDEVVYPNFRIGTADKLPFPGGQYPVEALDELSKQAVPDLSMAVPSPNPTYKALSNLAAQLKGTVLVSHSQSGHYPLEAALVNPAGIKGMVLLEPGHCPSFDEKQIATLAKIPTLVIYGDHLDIDTGIPGFSWQGAHDSYKAFVARVNAAGGKAKLLYLPGIGIEGNSHMLMQDRNSLQVAGLVLEWVEKEAGRK